MDDVVIGPFGPTLPPAPSSVGVRSAQSPPAFERARTTARPVGHVALLGTFPPRRCGIATFTADIDSALKSAFPTIRVDVYAMDAVGTPGNASAAALRVREGELQDYALAADRINASAADLLWIQHEYGIYGGRAGDHLLHLLDRVRAPVIATLHTVLENPDADQRRVTKAMLARASAVIVMAERGRALLVDVYGAEPKTIRVIPHGVPDRVLVEPEVLKPYFRWSDRQVILSFGLLAPNKGIEAMIAALPAVVEAAPKALYVVLGATHPNLVATEGEAYRRELEATAEAMGLENHISFIDRYVDDDLLIDYLQAADIYVTPYTNPAQITSGTLAYAVGVGKVVVSTPYAHARELLADDVGVLVGFGDVAGLGRAIVGILADDRRARAISLRAYARGRSMIWPRLAAAAMSAMIEVVAPKESMVVDRCDTKAEDWQPRGAHGPWPKGGNDQPHRARG